MSKRVTSSLAVVMLVLAAAVLGGCAEGMSYGSPPPTQPAMPSQGGTGGNGGGSGGY